MTLAAVSEAACSELQLTNAAGDKHAMGGGAAVTLPRGPATIAHGECSALDNEGECFLWK